MKIGNLAKVIHWDNIFPNRNNIGLITYVENNQCILLLENEKYWFFINELEIINTDLESKLNSQL